MISSHKPVRIIERKRRVLPVEGKVLTIAKTQRETEREMAQIVSSWIDERREVVKEFARSNSARSLLRLRSNLEI